MRSRIGVMRFEELLERWETGVLSQAEAAAALGVSERTFRRWRGRYGEDGAAGLVDRRVGKPSPRRAAVDELQRMLKLYHEHYAGFAIRHFHDTLRRRHGYKLGYTTTRLWLQKSGAVAAAAKRGAHRRKRPRRAMVGMMLHQDGSTHAWLVGQPALDLVLTLDDATSAIYSAVLVDQEGTASTFRGLTEVIERHGLFIELYTDRGSHYFLTPAAGGKVSKTQLTQVGRALKQLGIGHIAAYSPQARGRCERAFRTLRVAAPSPQEPIARDRGRTGCRRSCGWPGSPPSRPPTATCARSTCLSTTRASPSAPTSRPRPSWRRRPSCGATCSASRRSARSATTIACAGRAACCRSRPARCGRTSSGRRCGCTPIPTARSRSSRARTVSPPSRRRPSRRPRSWPRDHRDAAKPVDLWTALRPAHNPTGPTTAANSCAPYGGQVNALATANS